MSHVRYDEKGEGLPAALILHQEGNGHPVAAYCSRDHAIERFKWEGDTFGNAIMLTATPWPLTALPLNTDNHQGLVRLRDKAFLLQYDWRC